MLRQFRHRVWQVPIAARGGLGRRKTGAIIVNHHVKAQPVRQGGHGFADVPGANHDYSRFRLHRFHKHFHLTATHAGIAALGVSHIIF